MNIPVIIIFILSISFVFSSATAQKDFFVGGVFFNPNGLEIKGDKYVLWPSSTGTIWGAGGLSGGINVKRNISRDTYMSLELRYIQKGSIYEYVNSNFMLASEVLRLNYMEIPLQAGISTKAGKTKFYLETGPGIGKMFSSDLKINQMSNLSTHPDISRFKSMDISWIGSLKFHLNPRRSDNLLLGVRYSFSIFSIHKSYKLYNNVYGIQLEYLFKQVF